MWRDKGQRAGVRLRLDTVFTFVEDSSSAGFVNVVIDETYLHVKIHI